MSDKPKSDKPAKRGGKLKLILTGLVALLVLGGGGAAAGYWFAGADSTAGGHAPDPNVPQLVPRGEGEHAVAPEGGSGGGHGAGGEAAAAGDHAVPPGAPEGRPSDPSRYTATYYTIETPFTSNLKDSDAFVQVTLGVATYYDSRVLDNVRAHEMAIRNAVLMRLSEQDELLVASPQGRTLLQRDLTQAINGVLREKTGFGGIDNVYFTSFVVQ